MTFFGSSFPFVSVLGTEAKPIKQRRRSVFSGSLPFEGVLGTEAKPIKQRRRSVFSGSLPFEGVLTTEAKPSSNQSIATNGTLIPGKELITDTNLIGKQVNPINGSRDPFAIFWPGTETLSVNVSNQPGLIKDVAVAFSLTSLSDNDAKGIFVTLISPQGVRVPIAGTKLPSNYLAYQGLQENPRDTFNLNARETRSFLFSETAEASDNFGLSLPIRSTLQESQSEQSLAAMSSLQGASGNGEWQLEVRNSSDELIQINDWQLFLKTAEAHTFTDAAGKYSFDGLASSNLVGPATPWIEIPNDRILLTPAGAINTSAALSSPSIKLSFGLSTEGNGPGEPQVRQQNNWNRFDRRPLTDPKSLHPETTLNQAVTALNADAARVKYGVDGTGIKIGIISNSYNAYGGAAWDYNRGVLNQDRITQIGPKLDGLKGRVTAGEDEGRAMIQNIHSIAPGAQTYFRSWYDTYFDDVITAAFDATDLRSRDQLIREAFRGYAQQQEKFRNFLIELARNNKTRIIVDDVGDSEPWFEDGPMAKAIQYVKEEYGVSYFTAAGNYKNNSYQNTFNPVNLSDDALADKSYDKVRSTLLRYKGYEAHQFTGSKGSTLLQEITGTGFETQFYLQWNDKWGENTSKVKVLTFDKDKNFTGEGLVDPDGKYPWASFQNSTPNATTRLEPFYIAILHTGESADTRPDVIKWVGNQRTTVSPNADNGFYASTAFGHANGPGSTNVGSAQYWSTPAYRAASNELSRFSSWGVTPIYFDSSGNKLDKPIYRQTPAFIAPQKGNTTFFSKGYQESQSGKGDQFESDLDYLQNFEGTSAAAPNTAAVAALMLQLNPSLTPDQIVEILRATTSPVQTGELIGSSEKFTPSSGFGLINAGAALDAIARFNLSGLVYEDINSSASKDTDETGIEGVRVFLDSNGNRQFDPGDIWQSFSASSGAIGQASNASQPTLVYDSISGLLIDSRYRHVIHGTGDISQNTSLQDDSLVIATVKRANEPVALSVWGGDITLDGDLLIQFNETSNSVTGTYKIIEANSISGSFDNIFVRGLDKNLFISIGIDDGNNVLATVSDQYFIGSIQATNFY